MKHLKDAQILLNSGDGVSAMAIIENILGLAPRNPEAIRLKAQILDAWGRFDESMQLLHSLAQMETVTSEAYRAIEERAIEEKEGFIFSEITPEGRLFYAHPTEILWITAAGFLGCATFLIVAPQWFSEGTPNLLHLFGMFSVCVLVPWFSLMVVHMRGIKRVLVGIKGMRISTRFQDTNLAWDDISAAVIIYDHNVNSQFLQLTVYSKREKLPMMTFDISKKTPVVRARRHFLRSVLTHVDTICYVPRAAYDASQFNPQDIRPAATHQDEVA